MLARFFKFIALLFTPRRSFAYRQLEQQCDELKEQLKEDRKEIRALHNYILMYAGRIPAVYTDGLRPGAPPEKKPLTPTPSNKPTYAEMDKKYKAAMRKERDEPQVAHVAEVVLPELTAEADAEMEDHLRVIKEGAARYMETRSASNGSH